MSRHAQLPPRCPLQKKTVAPLASLSISPPSGKGIELHPKKDGHLTTLEEQPPWLNDLLSDSDSSSNGTLHHRTCSDTSTLLDDLMTLPDLEKETGNSCDEDDGLGSKCTYGPNSPRMKKKLGSPENEIVSAFSEYARQNPVQYFSGYNVGVLQSESLIDAQTSADQISENKPLKSHPGQRSRARKLQYIAELESTVDTLQNMGSELAIRVSSLVQQYTALAMENSTLKQQLLRMKQEKYIVHGEYQSLKKEVERLRSGLGVPTIKNHHTRSHSAVNFSHPNAFWDVLDMQKLDLN